MTAGGARSISERLFEIAECDPERELVFDPLFGRFTYADVAGQVRRLAHGLRETGFGPGDVVVLQLPNWSPFLVFHLALSAIGAITANIPFVYREREVGAILELTGARGLVVPGEFTGHDFRPMASALLARDAGLHHVFLVGPRPIRTEAGMTDYHELMRRASASRGAAEPLASLAPAPDDVTALGFTSGTTGDLKGAVFDTDILAAVNRGLAERYRLDEGDRIFGCSPLGHAVGFTHALRMTLTIGGSIVLLERWDAARAIELVHREKCTFMAAATPFLIDLLGHPDLDARDNLPSLRLFLCGGASIPDRLMCDALERLPHTFTSPLWGMTECGGVTCCPFDAPREKLFTTDGLPCESMEVKVVDAEGDVVPAGTDGELLVRGPMLTRGYFRQPELTAQSWQPDGFFRTGDLARMDEDGYVKITGRIKDLIVRGGVNISPAEIESVLFAHPSVANVAVVGAPDPRLGERACAFVIPGPGATLTLEDVQEWMRRSGVAKPKWPERIELVDDLPMTSSGKVQKFRLREEIAKRIAGESGPGAT